ncbi:MAG TPA: prefoldin subunit alpha [Nitrososphaerales archaeon]|nr:prefoldin subunit alpha [Nitrososphaerales archaeon]
MSKQPTEEEALNALLVEVRVLESTYNELTARQNLLERALVENRAALDTLNGLGPDSDSQKEVLMQIGGGAMLRSRPPSTDKVLVGVGASVVIEKPKSEAVAMIEERTKEVEKTIMSIAGQRNEIAQRLDSDRQVLNSMVSRKEAEQ